MTPSKSNKKHDSRAMARPARLCGATLCKRDTLQAKRPASETPGAAVVAAGPAAD